LANAESSAEEPDLWLEFPFFRNDVDVNNAYSTKNGFSPHLALNLAHLSQTLHTTTSNTQTATSSSARECCNGNFLFLVTVGSLSFRNNLGRKGLEWLSCAELPEQVLRLQQPEKTSRTLPKLRMKHLRKAKPAVRSVLYALLFSGKPELIPTPDALAIENGITMVALLDPDEPMRMSLRIRRHDLSAASARSSG